ncbi:hypothetical protein NE237_009471 [Protea cynaroides]|uniref:Uncharacterized protein n=1 Tax=Protea cynaroides TaxID=273540 RepID=A0A9Q0KYE7_9MAGN|nr:hypothetical protein NE237_009471 [Protea cynaroides]
MEMDVNLSVRFAQGHDGEYWPRVSWSPRVTAGGAVSKSCVGVTARTGISLVGLPLGGETFPTIAGLLLSICFMTDGSFVVGGGVNRRPDGRDPSLDLQLQTVVQSLPIWFVAADGQSPMGESVNLLVAGGPLSTVGRTDRRTKSFAVGSRSVQVFSVAEGCDLLSHLDEEETDGDLQGGLVTNVSGSACIEGSPWRQYMRYRM